MQSIRAPVPLHERNCAQRVKLYRLNENGKWDDWGTGHVSVEYLEKSEDLGLVVINEEDNNTLLSHRISSEEIYTRQEETIISWRDTNFSTELALSFQEPAGCSYIWDQICGVRRNLHFTALGNMEFNAHPAVDVLDASGSSLASDEACHGGNNDLRELPFVGVSTLPQLLKLVVGSNVSSQMRVAELLVQDRDFFPKLVDLFRMSEDLDNIESLHMIFRLFKGIILLNSPQIFDKIFSDEFVIDVIGALEYDPDVPKIQQHRSFIKEHVVFKEAIAIRDPVVLARIHQSYRVGYIKDVILPRALDEATTSSLNSIIRGNNAAVVARLKDDKAFIEDLFAKMKSSTTSLESKKNLVLFLQEFCSLSKSLPLVQQLRLFRDLASEGVFDIITEVLRSHDKKLISAGTDILILFLNQDPHILRTYIVQQEGQPLLDFLVKGLVTDSGEDLHCQFLEIIRILLDSYTSESQRDVIIDIFYEKHLEQIMDIIASSCPSSFTSSQSSLLCTSQGPSRFCTKAEILLNICDILCFCVVHHPYRIKSNILHNNIIEKVLCLLYRKEKYLGVAAVRFIRTIVSRNDDQLLRHVVKNNLFKPIIDAFIRNGNRYNMLNSGVLELFEHIRKSNLKLLIKYVIDNFWDQLSEYNHLEAIQTLKVKYEQSLEDCTSKATSSVEDPRKRTDERGLDREEEDYFNEDSDEEDSASVCPSQPPKKVAEPTLPNGKSADHPSVRTRTGRLVDYDDDDDDDYNPPPKQKTEVNAEDAIMELPISKRKQAPTTERCGTDVRKRRMLGKDRSENGVVGSDHATSGKKDTITKLSFPPVIVRRGKEEKCDSSEPNNGNSDSDSSEPNNGNSDTSPSLVSDTRDERTSRIEDVGS